ncbi:TIGR03619 family F420-dependent LLM class oxidoreductase [Nocardiopsis sp. CNT-189]|uniref:TIGR03619 family F420-dependent LLM class oxidoreductase n=1 Tax=Nocardiopsis oceanisediminis TaxID=2816862 RepID=UPI003B352EFB
MRLGFALPQFGAAAHRPEEAARFAREAEGMGAASLWAGDRLLAPVHPSVGYGGSDALPPQFRSALDPFVLLTAAAGATERALLGTSVLNAPWYPPALLARSLTAIDRISGGRLLPGLGTGWSPEEYRAAGVPMGERGRRLDECLDALEELWSDGPAEYRGELWEVPESHVDLKPVQRPRPPIYLGAFAPAALRRVARRADGWLPVAVLPGRADPVEAVAGPLAAIREEAARQGRDPSAVGAVLRINAAPSVSVSEIAEAALAAEQEAGVEHAFVDLMYLTEDTDRMLELADRLLEKTGAR